MAETLLQKAQRLGIQPVGTTENPRIAKFRAESKEAQTEFERVSSPLGQAKEFTRELGEITGISPTGRRIAAAISPLTESEEDFANVVEELVGGVRQERKMGILGKTLQNLGVNENISEGADIALDLPLISLGLSRNIAKTLGKGASKIEIAKDLTRPLSDFLPEYAQKILQTDLFAGPRRIKEGAEEFVEAGKEKAVKGARKLLQEPIPEQTQTALKETPTAIFDVYVSQGQRATKSFKELTPLEFSGQRAQGALNTIQRKLNNIGSEKQSVLDKAAVGNKPVGNIAVKFRQNLIRYLKGKTLVEGDNKLLRDIVSEAEHLGADPQAKDVDKFIDFIQSRIYTANRDLTVPVTDRTTGFLREITGQLNEGLKNQLPDSYRNLNKQYSDIVGIRDELNQKLGKEGERGGALMKRVFSPSDANTKKLFAEVEKLTDIDLVDEATIARFVMETLGDARQKSLLEELKLPRLDEKGLLQFLIQVIRKRFNKPKEVIKRARGMTVEDRLPPERGSVLFTP